MTLAPQPLHRVRARGFRNLAPLDWSPAAGIHLILGPNGAGKTSLLEAIYLAATTRSFRAPRLEEARRHGAEAFHLSLAVGPGGRCEVEFGWSEGSRRRTVNGEQLSLVEHLGQLPLVLWTASEKELLSGGPSIGRRVLDRGVVSRRPALLSAIGRYRRALEQKRRLLATTRDRESLRGYNRVLAEAASEVIEARQHYVVDLRQAFGDLSRGLDLGLPEVEIHYRSNPSIEGQADAEALFEALESATAREVERRQPLVGPHRDRLRFRWQGRELRHVASAGELKAIGLILVAAQGRVLEAAGRPPLYLLDDLDTELDPDRLRAVWMAFGTHPQAIATSSRPAVWSPQGEAHHWSMAGGILAPR